MKTSNANVICNQTMLNYYLLIMQIIIDFNKTIYIKELSFYCKTRLIATTINL